MDLVIPPCIQAVEITEYVQRFVDWSARIRANGKGSPAALVSFRAFVGFSLLAVGVNLTNLVDFRFVYRLFIVGSRATTSILFVIWQRSGCFRGFLHPCSCDLKGS